MSDTNMILIFAKSSGEILGQIEYVDGGLILKDAKAANHKKKLDLLTKKLPHIKPFRIIGVSANSKNKQMIVDATEFLDYKDSLFWGYLMRELSCIAPEFYFVIFQFPIRWEKIEEELGLALGSGMLEKNEKETILAALPKMDEKQIILTHHLLSQMYKNFR